MRARSVAAAVAVVVLALTGCGGGSSGPHHHIKLTAFEQRGKALFISTCGACHTLADAGTDGMVGPAFTSPYAVSLVRATIAHGLGQMQGGLLTGTEANEVAAYVAAATK